MRGATLGTLPQPARTWGHVPPRDTGESHEGRRQLSGAEASERSAAGKPERV